MCGYHRLSASLGEVAGVNSDEVVCDHCEHGKYAESVGEVIKSVMADHCDLISREIRMCMYSEDGVYGNLLKIMVVGCRQHVFGLICTYAQLFIVHPPYLYLFLYLQELRFQLRISQDETVRNPVQ